MSDTPLDHPRATHFNAINESNANRPPPACIFATLFHTVTYGANPAPCGLASVQCNPFRNIATQPPKPDSLFVRSAAQPLSPRPSEAGQQRVAADTGSMRMLVRRVPLASPVLFSPSATGSASALPPGRHRRRQQRFSTERRPTRPKLIRRTTTQPLDSRAVAAEAEAKRLLDEVHGKQIFEDHKRTRSCSPSTGKTKGTDKTRTTSIILQHVHCRVYSHYFITKNHCKTARYRLQYIP